MTLIANVLSLDNELITKYIMEDIKQYKYVFQVKQNQLHNTDVLVLGTFSKLPQQRVSRRELGRSAWDHNITPIWA